MELDYRISLWNYGFYARASSLEETVQEIVAAGYGVELHSRWKEEQDLYGCEQRKRLRALLRGVRVSLHSGNVTDFEGHGRQIDCAAEVGADPIVVHTAHLGISGEPPAYALAREVLAYAQSRAVRLALENGPLPDIRAALEALPSLSFCLDVGHCYADGSSIPEFLDAAGERLIHVHLQDRRPGEKRPWGSGHYRPGAGAIPREHWQCLAEWIRLRSFRGALVFEVKPLPPVAVAQGGRAFLAQFFQSPTG